MALKHCKKCNSLKPYSSFYASTKSPDRLQYSCKKCWDAAGILRFTAIGGYQLRAQSMSLQKARKRGRPMKRRPYRTKHNPLGLTPEERT